MSWLGSAPRDFLMVLRDGFRIWWLAPAIPLLVVIPEAAQHVAEIRIGMFEGIERAREVANAPERMVWGYLKIAGLVLAILAAIRFWGAEARGDRWWDLRRIGWLQLLVALAGLALASVPGMVLEPAIGARAAGWADTLLMLATLPLFVLLVAGLAGDRAAGLRAVYRTGWLPALRIAVFAAMVWIPLAWLHTQNHRWAMGAPSAQVWALMGLDALMVGLMAVLAGTAIHHGYASPSAPERLHAQGHFTPP